MATNKQPMLVDRPLRVAIALGGITCLTSAGNWNTPAAGGLTLVCSGGTDGAILDSVQVLATEASTTTSRVLLFLSSSASASLISASNTSLVGWVQIVGSALGDRANMALPPLLAPIPNLASPAATMATYPSETDKKNTGMLIQTGQYLYAGVDVAITAPSSSTRVILSVQGGYY
jgi:hypothetical protein